ncbi:cell envelope integrity protein CreD [Aquincola sp. S2]|uniref:Cell envelope integrity protein CreD n=1 Tax=Pseudaquabacterium terrae TaxID=2732868 RepID=A0ABX2EKU4_9BURK|nr:cell envelope integrity protein CreD [Aquabacterium terrae]NRF69274.1 cell envelope integrity protein CreD [Aquabacterium terrae]
MRFPLLAKFLSIGVVLLLMGGVLMRIGFLVDERQARQQEAVRSVEQSHAGAQTLAGPWLHRACTEEWEVVSGEGKERKTVQERRIFALAAVPARLEVQGQTQADVRRRGLYRVNSYGAQLTLQAEFSSLAALQPQREHAGSKLACGPALLTVALSDVRGVRAANVSVDGQALTVRPGTLDGRRPRGLHTELPPARLLDAAAQAPFAARVTLELSGTSRLALVPAADATRWTLNSDWPHPSFDGRFLPSSRQISERGFSASWSVSSLASSAPAELLRGAGMCDGSVEPAAPSEVVAAARAGCLDTLSVSFFDPVNPHVLSDRAIKYGLLFVVLTFIAVALVEALSGQRVHPVQYLLVGLVLSLFFLLLLSLSEHLPFAAAYAAAATACALLLGYYAVHMLGRWIAGAAFGASIAALYGLLYALLQMEQNALVIGSLGLFGALAAVMLLTRRIDWYALFDGWRSSAAGRARAAA